MESMTGFASFSPENGTLWTWTLRSVNAKGLEIRCRCPAGYEDMEPKIRECLRSFLPAAVYPFLWIWRRIHRIKRRGLISRF